MQHLLHNSIEHIWKDAEGLCWQVVLPAACLGSRLLAQNGGCFEMTFLLLPLGLKGCVTSNGIMTLPSVELL